MSDGSVASMPVRQINMVEALSMHFVVEVSALVTDAGLVATRIGLAIIMGNLSFDVHYYGAPNEAVNARIREVAEKYNVALKTAGCFFSLN